MPLDDLDLLVRRLQMVEQEEQFLKRCLFGTLAGLLISAALFLATANRVTVVRAREFVLNDAEGNVRARWTTTQTGASGLELYDTRGGARASISVAAEGSPALVLADRDENPLAAIAATERGPALALSRADGTPIFTKP